MMLHVWKALLARVSPAPVVVQPHSHSGHPRPLHKRLILAAWLLALLLPVTLLARPGHLLAQGDEEMEAFKQELWEQGLSGILPLHMEHGASRERPERIEPQGYSRVLDQWAHAAFQGYEDGNWELYVIRDFPSYSGRLTWNRATDSYPRLNRGATQLVFVSNRDTQNEIYRINYDGTGETRLTWHPANDTYPVWSPDSSRVAFTSDREGHPQIYVMNADGSGVTRLTWYERDDVMPSWSPDGQFIAFVRRVGDNAGVLSIVPADGSSPAWALTEPLPYLLHPVWSPDSTRLAFDYEANGDLTNDLAIFNLADQSLTTFPMETTSAFEDIVMAEWTRLGDALVYSHISYNFRDGQLWLSDTEMNAFVPDRGWIDREAIYWGPYALFPTVQSTDPYPPDSHVLPLPPYSRASDLYVWWTGQEVGASGLANYDLQVKVGVDGVWEEWLREVPGPHEQYIGTPGSTVSFRARGRDVAGNVEPWPPEADAVTRLYSWQVHGRVQDNRGIPVPVAAVAINPPPVSLEADAGTANYFSRLGEHSRYQVGMSHAGYGPVPPLQQDAVGDASVVHVLPPADNHVSNGSFESGLEGWSVQGAPEPVVTDQVRHGANLSARLGPTRDIELRAVEWGLGGRVTTDHMGNVHMIGTTVDNYTTTGIHYYRRTPRGEWSGPIRILTYPWNHGNWTQMFPDEAGGVHLFWRVEQDNYHCHLPATATTCNDTTLLLPPGLFEIDADGTGVLHMLSRYAGETVYRRYTPGQGWNGDEVVPNSSAWTLEDFRVDKNGRPHLLVRFYSGAGLYYTTRSSEGQWLDVEYIPDSDDYYLDIPRLVPIFDEGVYVVWEDRYGQRWETYRRHDGTWSRRQPVHMEEESWIEPHTLFVDDFNSIHHFSHPEPDDPMYHYIKEAGKEWMRQALPLPENGRIVTAHVSNDGMVHLLVQSDPNTWPVTYYYAGYPVAPEETTVGLSRLVWVPDTQPHPTLSFLVRADRPSPPQNRLTLSVFDGVTTTEVLRTPVTGAEWVPLWADLSPWAGQAVTIQFQWEQAGGRPWLPLFLDDISLGPWQTPVVSRATWQGSALLTSVTLFGDNFQPGVRISVNGVEAREVVWRSATEVQATFEALAPGYQRFWALNPAGQEGISYARIGEALYLPAVHR